MNPDRPTGPEVSPLPSGKSPDRSPIAGRYSSLLPLKTMIHGEELWRAIDGKDPFGKLWTYMAYGPFASRGAFVDWLGGREAALDAWFYVYHVHASKTAEGMGSFMRADPVNGVIEIGNIWLGPALQRTRAGTEVIYLMMRHAFEHLKVRRLEWKCDALNAPSRRAALRYGFTFEGIFRQHMIIKGRNRDTAWYAIIDKDWPRIREGFDTWLDPANFDENGIEKAKLRLT